VPPHCPPTRDVTALRCPLAPRPWPELVESLPPAPDLHAVCARTPTMPRLVNTCKEWGVLLTFTGGDGQRVTVLPASAAVDSGADSLYGSVEALRRHGITLGAPRATVHGVGGARACAVTLHPVEVTIRAGTAHAVTVHEQLFALEGVDDAFDFLIGFHVLYRLGAMLDPLRGVLWYPPRLGRGNAHALAWIPLHVAQESPRAEAPQALWAASLQPVVCDAGTAASASVCARLLVLLFLCLLAGGAWLLSAVFQGLL
jgi:hypothetical protein